MSENQVPPSAPAASKPEGVPDKFWNAATGTVDVAGLAKSYTSLEREFHTRASAPAPAAATPPVQSNRARVAELQQRAAQELQHGGGISDETFRDFDAVGIDRETVTSVAQLRQQQAQAARDSLFKAAGGEDAFNTMSHWARVNDPSKLAALNNALSSPDGSYREFAVKQLADAYNAANGREGTMLTPNTLGAPQGGGNGNPFQTPQEVVAAMKKPEYSSDPAYREQVKQRISASMRAGIDLNLRIVHNGQRIA